VIDDGSSLGPESYAVPRRVDGTFNFLSGSPRGVYLAIYSDQLIGMSRPAIVSPGGFSRNKPAPLLSVAIRSTLLWQDYRDSSTLPAILRSCGPDEPSCSVSRRREAGGSAGIAANRTEPSARSYHHPTRCTVRRRCLARCGRSSRQCAREPAAPDRKQRGGGRHATCCPWAAYIARLHAGTATFSKQFRHHPLTNGTPNVRGNQNAIDAGRCHRCGAIDRRACSCCIYHGCDYFGSRTSVRPLRRAARCFYRRSPVETVPAADARIQSVGRIGILRIAVWGTSISGADGSATNQLRVQLLRDTLAVGPQTVLTGSAARPFRVRAGDTDQRPLLSCSGTIAVPARRRHI